MRTLVALMAVAFVSLAGASPAAAQDLICSNTPGPGAFTGTANNVVVPPGATCFLIGAEVESQSHS